MMKKKTASQYLIPSLFFFLLIWMMTGCSVFGDEEDLYNETEEYVFVSEFFSLEEDVESITVYEGNVYYCNPEGEVKCRKPVADATSETIAVLNFDQDTYVLERRNLQLDLEGNLYVLYMVRKKNSSDTATYLAKYNAAGLELFQKDVSQLFPYGMGEVMAVDAEKHLFVVGKDGRVFGFDTDGTHRKTIAAPNDESIWGLACDEESKVYCSSWGSKSSTIRTISWEYGLSDTEWKNFMGISVFSYYQDGQFLTALNNLANLYLYNCADQSQSKVLAWANYGIEPNQIRQCFSAGEDKILVFLKEYGSNAPGEVAVLTRMAENQAPKKEYLTLGVFSASNSLMRTIARYNRQSEVYQLVVKEYYDAFLDNGGDSLANAQTALHLDIVSGRCPDILNLEYEDLTNYASKGLLEDLSPYLEGEGNLELLPEIAESYTFDGKLVSIPQAVQIRTIMGRTEDIGNGNGWTLEELKNFIESHFGEKVFSIGSQKMLKYCLYFNQSNFVDWEHKTCDFTSESFYELLKFCKQFEGGSEYASMPIWGIYFEKEAGEEALLYEVEINEPYDIVLLKQMLDTKELTFAGFPTSDGNPGHLLEAKEGSYSIAAGSLHKKAAWEFIKLLLNNTIAPQSQAGPGSMQGFPVDNRSREEFFASAMENPYEIFWGAARRRTIATRVFDTDSFEYYVPLQEDMDPILALLDTAQVARNSDEQILSIIQEESAAFFDGQKSAEETAEVIQNKVSIFLQEQE